MRNVDFVAIENLILSGNCSLALAEGYTRSKEDGEEVVCIYNIPNNPNHQALLYEQLVYTTSAFCISVKCPNALDFLYNLCNTGSLVIYKYCGSRVNGFVLSK